MEQLTEANAESRKRKTHTKSKKGCRNCKLRRVKCDETKPTCEKCISYGVSCNYSGSPEDELQLPGEDAFTFASTPKSTSPIDSKDVSTSPPEDDESERVIEGMLGMPLTLQDSDQVYRVTAADLETMRYFKNKTVYTIGTNQTVRTYRKQIVRLSSLASYVTHIVLTLTLMHERETNMPWNTPLSAKESFHYYHGTAIFNAILSKPTIDEADKDPLWAATALLGAIALASIDASNAEEAWPLKQPSVDDLDWLRMSDGKKEVWRLVDPLRPASVFREALDWENQSDPEPYSHRVPELELLHPYLLKIYNFNPFSPSTESESEDPYHTAASILTRVLELECNHSTIMYFLSFLGHMDPRFRRKLHEKDPKALLLLVWWYGKMCEYNCWWQRRRMSLEGQAICLYLEREHAELDEIVGLLDYPKIMTGLVGRSLPGLKSTVK